MLISLWVPLHTSLVVTELSTSITDEAYGQECLYFCSAYWGTFVGESLRIEKEEELYKFLEVQYHSLTALFNFIKNYHLNELELKQLSDNF